MDLRVSRRTVLRGLGTAIALPWLEAMSGRTAWAADAGSQPPVRIMFLEVPNGIHMADWTSDEEGEGFRLKPILEPVAAFRSRMLLLTGLTLDGARPHGDGGGDHARSCAAYLTGAHPKKTYGADIRNGVSVDQLAAQKIGAATRFPSLELGIDRGAQSGNCDSGYSCAYSANLSWRTDTTPVAKEVDPAALFDRLFGGGDRSDQAKVRAIRQRDRKSVLDFAADDAKRLSQRLGAADRRKLEEYLYAVRDVERRTQTPTESEKTGTQAISMARPGGVPREFEQHVKVLFDLVALAFQTDATRVVTFMYANEGSNRNYPQIGVEDGHHDLSHHGNDSTKQAKISKINRYHVSLLAHLLERLTHVQEQGRSLLDQCMIVYGSGISDGNRHNHDDLPIVMCGQGGGSLRPGRHVRYPQNTPLTNLYLKMLQMVGLSIEKFGDSTQPLDGLT